MSWTARAGQAAATPLGREMIGVWGAATIGRTVAGPLHATGPDDASRPFSVESRDDGGARRAAVAHRGVRSRRAAAGRDRRRDRVEHRQRSEQPERPEQPE